MAEKKNYAVAYGPIQKFPDRDAVEIADVNGQTVRKVTIKAVGSQKLIRVTVWPEHADVPLGQGYWVSAEGKFDISEGKQGQTFLSLSASNLKVDPPASKEEREVVNQRPTASADEDAPF